MDIPVLDLMPGYGEERMIIMGDPEEAAPRDSAAHRPDETSPSQRDEDRRAADEDDLDQDDRDEEMGGERPEGVPRTPPDNVFHG
jgi:hypothetical protein